MQQLKKIPNKEMNKLEFNYDFAGWATKNDLLCSDGRTIRRDAFAEQDGVVVPMVWNHGHKSVDNVLGHALLMNKPEGVRVYGSFNDSDMGKRAKIAVDHGDITSLSIWANNLIEKAGNVMHGVIREVSLVLAGANPGAFIDTVMAHGMDDEDNNSAIIFSGEDLEIEHGVYAEPSNDVVHAEKEPEPKEEPKEESKKTAQDVFDSMSDLKKKVAYFIIAKALKLKPKEGEAVAHSDDTIAHADAEGSGQTVEDVWNTFTDTEKKVVIDIIVDAQSESDQNDNKNNSKEENVMHTNMFDASTQDNETGGVLTHADQVAILNMAKKSTGSLRAAMEAYVSGEGADHLAHGIDEIETLFPEYKNLGPAAPEMITTDQGWITAVMNGVTKSPISRIRTRQMDVKSAGLRALGYKKGNLKKEMGNVKLLKRTTDPHTIYVKDSMNHDDIVDITDFDVVDYEWKLMRLTMNEEIATAILVTDGRDDGDEDKIPEENIRPVYQDDELYTIHKTVDFEAASESLQGDDTASYFGDGFIYSEAIVEATLDARIDYRGSGNMVGFCTPTMLNKMLLARDRDGRRIYRTVSELESAMNLAKIYTVEQFENVTRTVIVNGAQKTKKLLMLQLNLKDYQVGATKGGEITSYNQFDIDFNKEKFLLETRLSGALVKIKSAIALEEDVA